MKAAGLAAAVRAEFSKLRSLRSTTTTLLLFLAISIGFGALEGWSTRHAIDTHSPLLRRDFTPEQAGLDGVLYGQLATIVLGVLLVTSEYGSGMIKLSLLAMPRRGGFYAAKMAVTALTVVAAAIPATVLCYAATELALGPHGAAITAPGVPRAMAGAVGYAALMSLLAAGLATMARNAIVPLATLLPLLLAGSQILSVIGATSALARYLPDQAGMRMLAVHATGTAGLSPAAGLTVLLAWTAAALGGGYLLLRRRDA